MAEGDYCQSLFSLEVIVEAVEDVCVSCYEPAIAFRLLDFPTVVIGSKRTVNSTNEISYEIRSGKSCLFKMSKELLYERLLHSPLYLMLIDTSFTKSKLLASTTIPLADCFQNILASVKSNGLDVPAVSGMKGEFVMYNLMGSHVATLKLCYRIFSFGVIISAHMNVSLSEQFKPRFKPAKENVVSKIQSSQMETPTCMKAANANVFEMKTGVQSLQHNAFTQTQDVCIHERHKSRTPEKFNEPVKTVRSSINDQNNISRPPPLYYNSMSTFLQPLITPVYSRELARPSNDQLTNLGILSSEKPVKNIKSKQYCDRSVQTCKNSGDYIHMQRNNTSTQDVSDNELSLPLIEALLNELSLVKTKYTRDDDLPFSTQHKSSKDKQMKIHHHSPDLLFPIKMQNQKLKTKKFVNQEPKKNLAAKSLSKVVLAGKVPIKFKKIPLKYGTTKTQMLREGINKKTAVNKYIVKKKKSF